MKHLFLGYRKGVGRQIIQPPFFNLNEDETRSKKSREGEAENDSQRQARHCQEPRHGSARVKARDPEGLPKIQKESRCRLKSYFLYQKARISG